MSDNKLHIEADALEVTLEGAPDRIEEAYEALRPTVVQRLTESLETSSGEPTREYDAYNPADDPDATSPMFCPDSGITSVPEATAEDHAPHFVVCNELSHSRAALKKREFDDSVLADIVDYDTIQTFYTNEETAEQLEDEIEFGETLWRELTSEGLAAISEVEQPS